MSDKQLTSNKSVEKSSDTNVSYNGHHMVLTNNSGVVEVPHTVAGQIIDALASRSALRYTETRESIAKGLMSGGVIAVPKDKP